MRKTESPVRSFAKSNRQLLGAFETYLISLNRSINTRRAYLDAAERLVEVLGSKDAADLDRGDIRRLQSQLLAKGVTANSIRLHIGGIRAFSKFLCLAGLTAGHDPTLLLSHRKLPSRVPRVLTVEEIERLIAASNTPLERAVVEVLYSTGVRLSELIALRVEDMTFSEPGVIRVLRGKGDKDRIVLFGSKAATAIREFLGERRSGFLFEAPPRVGQFFTHWRSWYARFYDGGQQLTVRLGKIRDLSEAEARAKFERLKAETPAFHPHPVRPYNARSIRLLLKRLAFRAKVAGVHPHAFRRAFATHTLERGADLRAIQDLLGHVNVTTTMIYTNLSAANLRTVHDRCHPHAKGD
jgi:integrase/recombinase XerD